MVWVLAGKMVVDVKGKERGGPLLGIGVWWLGRQTLEPGSISQPCCMVADLGQVLLLLCIHMPSSVNGENGIACLKACGENLGE